jgi:hypothetical protein
MANTSKLETPAFSIAEGTVTREAAGSRTLIKFTAPATRHLDGGFETSVYLVLFDADGNFVAKRSADSAKTVLSNRAAWTHEIETDKLANARRMVFEIQHRFDYRRKVCGGELPILPVESDGSDYWRWLKLDPRSLEDRTVKFDISLWARSSNLEITYSQTPKLTTDSIRSELELDLIDADGIVCFSKNFSISLNYGVPAYEDTSISMDRKALRALRFFELRARTEGRSIVRLPIDTMP